MHRKAWLHYKAPFRWKYNCHISQGSWSVTCYLLTFQHFTTVNSNTQLVSIMDVAKWMERWLFKANHGSFFFKTMPVQTRASASFLAAWDLQIKITERSFPTALWQDIQTRHHNHMGICPVPKRMGKMHALSQWPTTLSVWNSSILSQTQTKHVIEFTGSCPFKDKC